MGDAKVIYQGPKVFWKTKVTLEVCVVEHFIYGVLEIVCFDSVLKEEAPRLFIDDNVLQSKIDASIVERLKDLEKEKMRLKGGSIDDQAVSTKVLRQARVEYILDRLFIKEYSAKEKTVVVELQFNFHDRESDSVVTVASMVTRKPNGLQSYKIVRCISPTSAKFSGGAPDRASTSPNGSAPTSAVASPREINPRNPNASFLASNAHLRARSLVPAATFSSKGNLEIAKASSNSGKADPSESTPPSRRRPPQSYGRRTAQAAAEGPAPGQGATAGEVGSADNSSEAALIDSLAKRFTRSISSFRSSFRLGSSQGPVRRDSSSSNLSKRPSFLRRLSYSLFGPGDNTNETSKTLSSLLSAHADLGEPGTENVTRANSDYMEAIKQRAQEDAALQASMAAAKEEANTAAAKEGRSFLGPLRRSLMFMSAGVSALSPTSASAAAATTASAATAGGAQASTGQGQVLSPHVTPRQQPLPATFTNNPQLVSGRAKHGSFAVLINTPKSSTGMDGQVTPKQSSAVQTARDAKQQSPNNSKPAPLQGTLGKVFTYMVGGGGSTSNRVVPAN